MRTTDRGMQTRNSICQNIKESTAHFATLLVTIAISSSFHSSWREHLISATLVSAVVGVATTRIATTSAAVVAPAHGTIFHLMVETAAQQTGTESRALAYSVACLTTDVTQCGQKALGLSERVFDGRATILRASGVLLSTTAGASHKDMSRVPAPHAHLLCSVVLGCPKSTISASKQNSSSCSQQACCEHTNLQQRLETLFRSAPVCVVESRQDRRCSLELVVKLVESRASYNEAPKIAAHLKRVFQRKTPPCRIRDVVFLVEKTYR